MGQQKAARVAEHCASLPEVTVSRYVPAAGTELSLDRAEAAVLRAHLPGSEAQVLTSASSTRSSPVPW